MDGPLLDPPCVDVDSHHGVDPQRHVDRFRPVLVVAPPNELSGFRRDLVQVDLFLLLGLNLDLCELHGFVSKILGGRPPGAGRAFACAVPAAAGVTQSGRKARSQPGRRTLRRTRRPRRCLHRPSGRHRSPTARSRPPFQGSG